MSIAPLVFTAKQFKKQDALNVTNEMRHMTPHDTIKWCQQEFGQTMELIGSGYYADVYQHPTNPNFVIKVSNSLFKLDKWCLFADAVKDLDLPWFPKILHTNTDGKCVIAVIEKLSKFYHSADQIIGCKEVDSELDEIYDTLINHIVVNNYMHEHSAIKMYRALMANGASAEHIRQHWDMLRSCYQLFASMYSQHKFDEDIHTNNVMLRGRQFVITDPIC